MSRNLSPAAGSPAAAAGFAKHSERSPLKTEPARGDTWTLKHTEGSSTRPGATSTTPEARLGTTHGRQPRAMNAVTTLATPDLVETVETVRALSVRRRRQATGNEGGASFDFAVCAHYCDWVLCTATRGVRHYAGTWPVSSEHARTVKRVSAVPQLLLGDRDRTRKDGRSWLIRHGARAAVRFRGTARGVRATTDTLGFW